MKNAKANLKKAEKSLEKEQSKVEWGWCGVVEWRWCGVVEVGLVEWRWCGVVEVGLVEWRWCVEWWRWGWLMGVCACT